jgi:uncharacterized protein YjbI with pentapeptide repeats
LEGVSSLPGLNYTTLVTISSRNLAAILRNIKSLLCGANLQRANLSMADLSNANLSGADLRWANLTGANLEGANLSNARLTNARLIDAILTNTRFRDSDLRGVIFDNTSFTRTMLDGALMYRTVFGNVDLSAAQGLERVKHWGPSLLGLEATVRSKGSLPRAFLRGIGVPEALLPQKNTSASCGITAAWYCAHTTGGD